MKTRQALKKLIANGDVVKITTADFNGKEFDGRPVELVGSAQPPMWFVTALESKAITFGTPGCTDYASFAVANGSGNPVWAGPGDYVIREVHSERLATYCVLPHHFLKLLGCNNIEDLAVMLDVAPAWEFPADRSSLAAGI